MSTGDVVTFSLDMALHKDYVPALAFGAQNENEIVVFYLLSCPT